MEDDAFLRGLVANPDDDTLRLVYADWLEEHEDRRGEFLRTAVAVRNAAVGQADLPEYLHRLSELRTAVTPAWVRQAHRSLADDDVREVVFRELLGNDAAVDTFVRVENDQDPSPYLFALLVGRCTEVQPASAAELRGGAYHDKRTGSRGCMVSVDGLEWPTEDRCNVDGGFFVDGLAAQGNLYQVGIRDGWWAVLEVSNLWIS